MRALYVQTPATLAGNLIGMALMVGDLLAAGRRRLRRAGWAARGALWVLRLLHYLRYRRQPDADDATLLRLARAAGACWCCCRARMWGMAVWLFWGLGTPYHQSR